ncbi:MAG: D-ribose pyranase [Comamonas sp.]|jgi:D-ribose pyranase|nr:D-ribose pyranase [Comamonas sp.]
MKKSKLLNAALSHLVAQLGHNDVVVVGDAGLPVPPGVPCIDLAIMRGLPSIAQVLEALESEMQVERMVLAKETFFANQGDAPAWLPEAWRELPMEQISHEVFKQRNAQARAVIRTGECTPYANVMLVAGVAF